MINRLAIILTIFYFSTSFSSAITQTPTKLISDSAMDIINPPNIAALNIMVSTLSSLKELRKQNQASIENVKTLIKIKVLPSIDIEVSTELVLKKHWHKLTNQQKLIFQQYIAQSLIKDYAAILSSYDKLDSVNIAIDPLVKRKNNKAIVKLIITLNENPKPIIISLKMIRSTHWRIYDVVFSGVSLMKNYRAQFNSHIKRKSLESLISKATKKINRIN